MAWIRPVYNRKNGQTRTTATDMNRIVNNIAELGGTPEKTGYTSGDVVKEDEWNYIVRFAQELDPLVTSSTRYDNINRIERALAAAHGFTWNDWTNANWNSLADFPWNEMGGV